MREIYPSSFLNIRRIIDEAECYQVIRDIRLPDGIRCPHCDSQKLIKHGKDDTQLSRQKYLCKRCGRYFDDLTDTIFEGHHQPLSVWVLCIYFMGLNLSNEQIAQELDLNRDDAHQMTNQLREEVVRRKPQLRDEAKITSPFVHLIFRPSLPDLQAQNPRNRSDYSCGFALSDRTNLT